MRKKHLAIKRVFLILILLLVTAIVAIFSINSYVINTVTDYIVSGEAVLTDIQYDCILVLGCGVGYDGTPSPMLADRLKRAVEIYHAGAAPKIIMSGDHGKTNYDEVNSMRDYAINQGVPAEDIFMDHAGFSTYESMYRAKEIFCAKSIIIVTQKYHLYRAVYISDKLGLTTLGVDADYREYYGQKQRDLREIAARCKDFATCIFKPKPTFLGEVIPVSGDGTVTCD